MPVVSWIRLNTFKYRRVDMWIGAGHFTKQCVWLQNKNEHLTLEIYIALVRWIRLFFFEDESLNTNTIKNCTLHILWVKLLCICVQFIRVEKDKKNISIETIHTSFCTNCDLCHYVDWRHNNACQFGHVSHCSSALLSDPITFRILCNTK